MNWHNPDNLPSAGGPPWRFLVVGEHKQKGDQVWHFWLNNWIPVAMEQPTYDDSTYRTQRPLPEPHFCFPEAAQQKATVDLAVKLLRNADHVTVANDLAAVITTLNTVSRINSFTT